MYMGEYKVLFNPKAGNGKGEQTAKGVETLLQNETVVYEDVTAISDYKKFFESLGADTKVVIAGGDGTLNRFANDTVGLDIKNELFYYPSGTGNDFMRDVAKEGEKLINVSKYLKNLPTATVNGKKYVFLNGIGYGIDGYCCEVGDKLRETTTGDINYAGIAIKGLLFHFKPVNAEITVDGQTYNYKKVWLAPTMKGRFYGGGMMPTPDQDRLDSEGNVSCMIMHGTGKLRTLMIFPSIFKGQHVAKKNAVAVHKGKNITVKFDRPTALQVDGETVVGVTEYSVKVK